MNNKILNLILLISGFTFGVEDFAIGLRGYARLLQTCKWVWPTMGSELPTDVQSSGDVIDPEVELWYAAANAKVAESIVHGPTLSSKVQSLTEGTLPASTKPSASEGDTDLETTLEGGLTAEAQGDTTKTKGAITDVLTGVLLGPISAFIADEDHRSLVPPKTAIAKAFIKTVLPCLKGMKSQKDFESLRAPDNSNKLHGWFTKNYKMFTEVICGIETTDTPEEVEGKLGLLDGEFVKEKMGKIIDLEDLEGNILTGKILHKFIRKSIRSLGLTGSEYRVAHLKVLSRLENDWDKNSMKYTLRLRTWKVERMLEEDYQKLGDKCWAILHAYIRITQNPDGPGFKLKWEKRPDARSEPPQVARDKLNALCNHHSYIPVVGTMEKGGSVNDYKFVPFTKGIRFEEMGHLFCLQVPN